MPRPSRLQPDQIHEVALRIAQQDGAAAVTMRRIAQELGVDPMAVQRHVGRKEDLLDAIAERALAQLPLPSRKASWQSRLRQTVGSLVDFAQSHPTLVPLVVAPGYGTRSGWAIVECVLAACEDAGLNRRDAAIAAHLVLNFAIGLSLSAGTDGGRWNNEAAIAALLSTLAPEDYPASHRHANALARVERDTSGRTQVNFLATALELLAGRSRP